MTWAAASCRPAPTATPKGSRTAAFKTRADYLDQVRAIVRQDIVDLMLHVGLEPRDPDQRGPVRREPGRDRGPRQRHQRHLGPARRAAIARRRLCRSAPRISRTSSTAATAWPREPAPTLTDLGLYSVTFVNDAACGPACNGAVQGLPPRGRGLGAAAISSKCSIRTSGRTSWSREEVGAFVNDSIIHTLAGVPEVARPEFLKIPFNGPKAVSRTRGLRSDADHRHPRVAAPERPATRSNSWPSPNATGRGSFSSGARSTWPKILWS